METCMLSQQLCQYLSRIFGSEKAVRVRRLYYGVEDCCNVTRRGRVVNSGSKAEGLNFPGSDIDIMYIHSHDVIYPDVTSCPQNYFPSLYISTDHSAPGFAHIYVWYGRIPTIRLGDGVYTENGIILQNSIFKNSFDVLIADDYLKFCWTLITKSHGPCRSTLNDSRDMMFSFELHSWPNKASEWILRPRFSDWPPPRLISNIVHESVLLVPVGSKFGSLQDNPNEWRISFSLAEKLLVHSFNHTQLMCYVLLKVLLNEILNKNVITKNLLCSYFMKTILFWTIEESGCSVWTPNNLVKVFRACITKLSYLLKQKHLPNYFIPENNMVEGKLSEESLLNLCTILDQVNNEGVAFTRRTDSLKNFLTSGHLQMTVEYHADETNALCSLLATAVDHYDYIQRKLCLFLNTFNTKLMRYLFYFRFLVRITSIPLREEYDLNRNNKSLYCNYKSLLGYSLIGAKVRLSSWLTVAIIFYSHKNYNNTLRITDFVQSQNLLMRNFSYDYEHLIKSRLSTLQKLKLRCCKTFVNTNVVFMSKSVIAKTDLFVKFSPSPFQSLCLSRVFSTYLRFMCFHHLQNLSKKRNALLDLFEMLEDISPHNDAHESENERCMWAIKACCTSNISIPDNFKIKLKRLAEHKAPSNFELYPMIMKQLSNDIDHWLFPQQSKYHSPGNQRT